MFNSQNIHRQHRRASIIVEAAILFPILFLLTFGIIEYGWMFLKHQQVTNAARQAARLAANIDSTNSQVNSQITTQMNNYGLGSSGYTTAISPANVATATRGQLVSVTISVPYANIDITGFTLLPLPTTISAQVTMGKEGS